MGKIKPCCRRGVDAAGLAQPRLTRGCSAMGLPFKGTSCPTYSPGPMVMLPSSLPLRHRPHARALLAPSLLYLQ